jgi:hypothetical protein
MLLDSNIIIYAAQAEHATLRQFIGNRGQTGRFTTFPRPD